MTKAPTAVTSFKLPVLLLQQIKQKVREGQYCNQSEFLREAVRDKLREDNGNA